MSETIDLVKDSTMQTIAEYLAVMAAEAELNLASSVNALTFEQIAAIVQHGLAEEVFAIGDQITTTYTYSGTEYEMPWDIVAFETVTLEDGEEVPGMILQSHYATCESLMFDGYEAFYYAEEGLSAGTYYITVGTGAGSNNFVVGDSWQFTLTEDVPEGGVLAGFRLMRDSGKDISSLYVYSYESVNVSSPDDYIEMAAISSGSDGTSLGEFLLTDGDLNGEQEAGYGSNRWLTSAYRQWLNSDADAGSWWSSQETYDLPPAQATTYAGFMQGLPDDFLAVLKPIQVQTATNTVTFDGSFDETYDTFFLPSLEQEYVATQIDGEGDYWPYWKQVLGLTEPQERYSSATVTNANENHIRYALNSQSSKQTVRLRSAYRGYAYHVWNVNSAGYVSYGTAYGANRSAPACCIC